MARNNNTREELEVDKTAEVLTLARRKVEYRWIQHTSRDLHGGVCAGQAIVDAVMELCPRSDHTPMALTDQMNRASNLVLAAAKRRGQGDWFEVPHWNDQPMRTQRDILDAFDEAIRVARGEVADPLVAVPVSPGYITAWTPMVAKAIQEIEIQVEPAKPIKELVSVG